MSQSVPRSKGDDYTDKMATTRRAFLKNEIQGICVVQIPVIGADFHLNSTIPEMTTRFTI